MTDTRGPESRSELSYTEEELETIASIRRAQAAAGIQVPTELEEPDAGVKVARHIAVGGYADMADEDIVARYQAGDALAAEYLLNKYKNFVRSKARSYFLIGADHEDIVQEGMIGLFKAVRDFRADKLTSFRAFAELCITRQIITAIKTATRQKHIPLNSYVSLNKPIYDDDSDRTLMDVLEEGRGLSPEDELISREDMAGIHLRLQEVLSPLEKKALSLYLDGHSYQEIAQLLHRGTKSIDNALQRVKRKMEKYMEETASAEET